MPKSETLDPKPVVLVADDISSNLDLLETIFIKAGFRVFRAPDGPSAMSVFESNRIDIAILDVIMPGIDGYELCKRMKSLSGKHFLPIILLSALTERQSKITGLECGADDFMSKPFDKTELIAKVNSLIRLKSLHDELEHSENVILTLAVAMEARDPYTRGHSTRVGEISMAFASFLGFGDKDREQIKKAGILHDIGKIGVSTELLCKDGKLTGEELEAVKRHAVIGEAICRPLASAQRVLPAIRNHHERWDGKGFPDGLSGEEIPLDARILSIADSFDAMVSKRPYREGRSAGSVVEVFRSEKSLGQWDPELVDNFVEMIDTMEAKDVAAWSNTQ